MKTKYPPIEPFNTGFLSVDSHHKIYYEESGNPSGLPVLFLHGGPGSGTNPGHRCFFNPKIYRIILMDQRGAGKSTPHASLIDNTTWHLVQDIELLRKSLHVDTWVVFGGSWGSTLALAYAETHPARVRALVLRGIFLGRKKELHWFYQFGAHHIFPDAWEKFLEPIPVLDRHDLLRGYYKKLTSNDPKERMKAAIAWSSWEAQTLRLIFDPALFSEFTQSHHADALARIECHYFINQCFFQTDNWLLENVGPLKKIPGFIVQGRYDIVCPMESAWELHKALPHFHWEVIPDAGHSASEVGIADALINIMNALPVH